MNKKTYALAKEIANTFNSINNNMFTKNEIKEAIKEYMYLLTNEKSILLNAIKEELSNGNKDILPLANKVLAF